eukprot:604227_1
MDQTKPYNEHHVNAQHIHAKHDRNGHNVDLKYTMFEESKYETAYNKISKPAANTTESPCTHGIQSIICGYVLLHFIYCSFVKTTELCDVFFGKLWWNVCIYCVCMAVGPY